MKKQIATLVVLVLLPIVINAQHIGTGLGYHTIAAKSDGTVYTWGGNGSGQLGNVSNADSYFPVAVYTYETPMAGKTITQVAAGENHSIALASDGTVYTWGGNGSGQLGNGSNTNYNFPLAALYIWNTNGWQDNHTGCCWI